MMKLMKVNDKFPHWIASGGITDAAFTGFISNLIYPYFNSGDAPAFMVPYSTSYFPLITYGQPADWLASLDVMFSMRYGQRKLIDYIADMKLHHDESEPLTNDEKHNTIIIAKMINLRFAEKWNKIAEALAIEYNPLENYDRSEDLQHQNSNTGTDTDTKTFGAQNQPRKTEKGIEGGWDDTDSESKTFANSKQTETWNKVSGFNGGSSNDGQPADYQKVTETFGSGATPYTESVSGSTGRRYSKDNAGTGDKAYKETITESGVEILQHAINNGNFGWETNRIHGNIGVTTSQQMLESELEIRKNILYDIILDDIADFICLSIY